MKIERDKDFYKGFCWFDWAVIYFISDIGSALIIVMLSGTVGAVMVFPIPVLAWLSYENFRSTQHDKESD